MTIYVNQAALTEGDGSKERPFKHINDAARVAKPGDEVRGNDGLTGEVESVNVLRQRVRILVEVDDEKEIHEYGVEDITVTRKRRRGQARTPKKEKEPKEQKELEKLEHEERKPRKGRNRD